MPLDRVTFLNSGYCTQSSYLAGRRSLAWTRFHAVFVYLEHPVHGPAVIDTGYSPHFRPATEPFPERFYRWLTPVHLDPRKRPTTILQANGIHPERIKTLFVSHFHGDHVAGLRDFSTPTFVYRRESYELLMRLSRWGQVHNGFLAKLIPEDFVARGKTITEGDFQRGTNALSEFQVLDYWGDGSLLFVDLPGHAWGHTGYIMSTKTERFFYIVDATWDVDVMLAARTLPRLSRGFQADYPAYLRTQELLRQLAALGEYPLFACHCPKTQALVVNYPGERGASAP